MRLTATATHEASAASPALPVITDKAALKGTVTVSGSAKYGETLTAVTTGMTSEPAVADFGTLTYQWKRNGVTNIGANSDKYTLTQADIGAGITVIVTAADCDGSVTSSPTGPIEKADAPDAPTLNHSVENSGYGYGFPKTVTIETAVGAEYSFNGGAYSRENVYISNSAEDVTLAIRFEETATHKASAAATANINTSNAEQTAPGAFDLIYTAKDETDYTVTIPATDGAEYSFDGSTWSDSNTKEGCLPNTTVTGYKRMAAKQGYNASDAAIASAALPMFRVQPPTAEPSGGSFDRSQTVTLSCGTDGAEIFYTLDGSAPTIGSTKYTVPIVINTTATLKAIAVKDGMTDSAVMEAAFTKYASGSSVGNGSSGGDSSYAPRNTSVTLEAQPDKSVLAKVNVSGTVRDGVLYATITEIMADDAINALSGGANGMGIQFNITAGGAYHSAAVTYERGAFTAMQAEALKYGQYKTDIFDFTLDTKGITGILSQTAGNVTVSAMRQEKLSNDAKAIIGTRPVFDITVIGSGANAVPGQSAAQTTGAVFDLKGGTASISIAYMPDAAEQTGNIYAVYVPAGGKPQMLANSSFDNGRVIFERNSLSVYGVGYKAAAPVFTDTTNHWAKDNIDFVSSLGLINGTAAQLYSPDANITRADFLTALGRLSGADVSGYRHSGFTDVLNVSPAMPYIEWAAANKIVSGTGGGMFSPETSITREQMAVMMLNYAEVTGCTLPVSQQAVIFADDVKISAYAKAAVKAIQQAGVISGRENNRFDPQGNMTRGEAAVIVRRFAELVIDEGTARGWVQNDSGGWQYIDTYGKAVTGWHTENNLTYYFDTNGVMLSGKRVQIGEKWYYFHADGVMK